ncbi:MAG: hypothetical protein KC729_07730 [Candidatus Eisenbacteria bacterium]|uniref:Uncharacterized protein n=1 Tax=Eiseniibacteriota bacterium TaxID=2212470 RepID=A0A956RPM1_UNCEI|nr:hypothetical protein [Candidatus Eisenbacteria bacterium]
MRRRVFFVLSVLVALALVAVILDGNILGQKSQGGPALLFTDGDFEATADGRGLRATEDSGGWYESRRDTKDGRLQLKLSTKTIGGNKTHKAMIKGSAKTNTYLSQRLQAPQDEPFLVAWDIYVRDVEPGANRSCFQMLGDDSIKGKGPNAASAERFVFLGFENAATSGKLNLIAFEGGKNREWSERTVLVRDLEAKRWYTITAAVDPARKTYQVSVDGVTAQPVSVRAFETKKAGVVRKLTHISFASWNDGPGTFYVDNVRRL